MTYGEIFDEFCKKFPNAKVDDYRPADPMFVSQLYETIPNAIIVWLKDGSEVIYMAKRGDNADGSNKRSGYAC